MKHKHYWFIEHSIWEGRKENEVAIMRYCDCGKSQAAFTSNWKPIPTKYKDMKETAKKAFGK